MPSARSWWRSSQGSCRSRGRSYPNQQAAPWHYEPSGGRGGCRRGGASPQTCRTPFGLRQSSGGGSGSPKVLFSRDGSMRVEFTNSRVNSMEPQGFTGPPAVTSTAPGGDPSLRTSKGSSFSSDGSWYDSPWGTGAEPVDSVFTCEQSVDNSSGYTTYSSTRTPETANSSSEYNSFFSAQVEQVSPGFSSGLLFPAAETNEFTSTSSGRTEDSGIGDSVILHPDLTDFSLISLSAASLDKVYTTHNSLPGFPPAPDTRPQQPRTASSSSSSALLEDVIYEEERSAGGVEQCYSSLTLPCRRPESVSTTCGNSRKDFLKNRIRRLSDWTGSLSRKKRRIQVRNDFYSSAHSPLVTAVRFCV